MSCKQAQCAPKLEVAENEEVVVIKIRKKKVKEEVKKSELREKFLGE